MNENKPTISEIASKGGTARALSLTSERRKDIAKQAIGARWHKDIPTSLCEGDLDFAGLPVPCAVLSDGTRLLSERGVTKGFGLKRGGQTWQQKDKTGARLPVFASAIVLKDFMDHDLRLALMNPRKYRPKSNPGAIANGINAELIPKVCDVWLKARDAGALRSKRHREIAAQADLIMRGLAHVGIIALVDEATGFQDYRTKDALAKILEAFVAKELQKWVRTFPPEFYKEMFRLRGLPFNGTVKRPQYIGHITNDLIYSRLAPGVLRDLKTKNPRTETGRRKATHHQWLTLDIGHPKLSQHVTSVTVLMKASDEWGPFKKLLDKALPPHKDMPLFEGLED